jgi:hypothetical protein
MVFGDNTLIDHPQEITSARLSFLPASGAETSPSAQIAASSAVDRIVPAKSGGYLPAAEPRAVWRQLCAFNSCHGCTAAATAAESAVVGRPSKRDRSWLELSRMP